MTCCTFLLYLKVTPILEAFGNAETTMNGNSSRFGKYLRLMFEENGRVYGASISEYLLEKSRVTAKNDNESTFHIFTYLIRGSTAGFREENGLTDSENHRCEEYYWCEVTFRG